MLLQTSSDSNKSNENTASVKASDFENVNTQNKDAKSDTESAQSPNGFVEEEIDDSFTDSLALLSIILICWSICIWSPVKYNISDYFDNIQYDLLKKISKANVITVKSSISKSH